MRVTVIHIGGGDRGHCGLIFIYKGGSGDSTTITDDHWRFVHVIDRHGQRLNIGQPIIVRGRDFYLVGILSFMVWRSYKRQFARARIDTECSLVCTSTEAVGLRVTVIHIGGGDRGHCGLIFIYKDGSGDSTPITDDHWRFVHVIDRHGQRLNIGQSIIVRGRDFYLVGILDFMIRRCDKRQFTGVRINAKSCLVSTTSHTISL